MELRRALLLFAIVLGMAAIASSITNPPSDEDEPATEPQVAPEGRTAERPAEPPPGPRPRGRGERAVTLRFAASRPNATRTLPTGRPATVLVEVDSPAQVEIPSLGLNRFAEPLTPARFDVLASRPGEHPIVVRPAGPATEPREIGVLEVVDSR